MRTCIYTTSLVLLKEFSTAESFFPSSFSTIKKIPPEPKLKKCDKPFNWNAALAHSNEKLERESGFSQKIYQLQLQSINPQQQKRFVQNRNRKSSVPVRKDVFIHVFFKYSKAQLLSICIQPTALVIPKEFATEIQCVLQTLEESFFFSPFDFFVSCPFRL